MPRLRGPAAEERRAHRLRRSSGRASGSVSGESPSPPASASLARFARAAVRTSGSAWPFGVRVERRFLLLGAQASPILLANSTETECSFDCRSAGCPLGGPCPHVASAADRSTCGHGPPRGHPAL